MHFLIEHKFNRFDMFAMGWVGALIATNHFITSLIIVVIGASISGFLEGVYN